jgi:hypothetical protein
MAKTNTGFNVKSLSIRSAMMERFAHSMQGSTANWSRARYIEDSHNTAHQSFLTNFINSSSHICDISNAGALLRQYLHKKHQFENRL